MNRLKYLRNDCRISLDTLHKYTNIAHSVASYTENCKRPIRQSHMDMLTTFYNVSTDYLLGKSDSGIVVFTEKDSDPITLNQVEYDKLRPFITITILERKDAIPIRLITKRNKDIIYSKYVVYRELAGSLQQYDFEIDYRKRVVELVQKMTNEDAKKTIKFIEEYICH